MDWLLHVLGIDTQQSYYYDFASGWGPKIVEMVLFVGIWYWHNNCHHHLCPRIGKYPLGHHKLCKQHHPDVPTRVTREYVLGVRNKKEK